MSGKKKKMRRRSYVDSAPIWRILVEPRGLTAVAVLLAGLSIAGCIEDARHSNPLDPLSDGYDNSGSVSGTVVDRLFRPVAGVMVRLTPVTEDGGAQRLIETDGSGSFAASGLPPGVYQVSYMRDGYDGRTDTLAVETGRHRVVADVRLNMLPRVVSASTRTLHISRWWPEDDLYVLETSVTAIDPDERPGIDSVLLALPSGPLIRLQSGEEPGTYGRSLPGDDLPGTTVHAVAGSTLRLRIVDREGAAVEHSIPGPARVVDATPVAVEPHSLETVDTPAPVLFWERMILPFDFTYQIEVVRDEVNADFLVHRVADVPPDSVSYRVPVPLPAGSYYWTVAIVDEYGNLSRSREAGFRVN